MIVRTNQLHSLFLATVLEPESVWGLAKYPRFGEIVRLGKYPLVRIR